MIAALPYLFIFALGILFGGWVVSSFDIPNAKYYISKLRAKKGAVINVEQDIEDEKPKKEKRKLFSKLKIRRNKR